MELNHIREFIQLSRTLNFLAASEELFISQSTLSRHIQALERELGAPLFTRTARHVELTDFGRRFLPYALELADTQTRYTNELVAELRRSQKVIIDFGGAMSPYNIANIFARFKEENPDITLELIHRQSTLKSLRNNECDFLLNSEVYSPGKEFDSFVFLKDTLVAVVPNSHKLAKRTQIELSELEGEKFILMKLHAFEDGDFMKACASYGFRPDYDITDGTDMIDFAALGQAIPIMFKQPAIFFAGPNVTILDIVPELYHHSVIVHRRLSKLSKPERRFLEYLKSIPSSEKTMNYR